MERVPTGIQGFDQLISGGIPKNSSVLFCGTPGTGKTIFGLQFLYNGASQFDEKCLYVTFEEQQESIIEQAGQFGWDLLKLQQDGRFIIMSIPAERIGPSTSKMIIDKCEQENISRLVIDSLSSLAINAPVLAIAEDILDSNGEPKRSMPAFMGDFLVKKFMYSFIDKINRSNVTSILIADSPTDGGKFTQDGISEFICDGLVNITFESMGGAFSRSLLIRKMRKTKNDEDIHPLEIGENGAVVHNLE